MAQDGYFGSEQGHQDADKALAELASGLNKKQLALLKAVLKTGRDAVGWTQTGRKVLAL